MIKKEFQLLIYVDTSIFDGCVLLNIWVRQNEIIIYCLSGLHKLWYPSIRDMSTWSKFGAHGEHGDVFPVLQLRCALILRELNQIFIACLFKGSQEQSFFPSNTLIFGISRDGSKNFNVRTFDAQNLST